MISLPNSIASLLSREAYTLDGIGKSGSQVLLFRDKVLKIQPTQPEIRQETALLNWLQGKLPVPKILACEEHSEFSYLLMTRLPGEMACAPAYMHDPRLQAQLLASALKLLWQVDISQCPVDQRLHHKLAAAQYQVDHGLVDMEDTQPDTFGDGGFRDPAHLLRWLQTHQPEEEPVLSHGDFCLPNILFEGARLSGFIDLGRGGIGDKWNDIALCYRSLRDNFSGIYTGIPTPGYDDMLLFRELGLEPDWKKIRYYILLDELF